MGGKSTKLFFITDIHGSDRCFRKFINAAKFYGADVLVLGGDITGKMIIPILEEVNSSTHICNFMSDELIIKSKEDLEAITKRIQDCGFYPFITTKKDYSELTSDRSKVDALFQKLMIESVDRWIKLAHQRLCDTNVKCYISPGNDDILPIDSHLIDTGVVFNPEGKVVKIDDIHEMITLGYVNHTPWNSPREIDEDVLEKMINDMCSEVRDMKNCLFNIHVPPINTVIDQAPKLDENLKPVIAGGQMQMISAGSVATRRMIEKCQPLAGIHGHIHESAGTMNIGRTTCFNPGSEYSDGILKGLILQLGDGKIRNYMLTAG